MAVFGAIVFAIIALFFLFDHNNLPSSNTNECREFIKKEHNFESYLDCEIRPELSESDIQNLLKYTIEKEKLCGKLNGIDRSFVNGIISRLYDYKYSLETNTTNKDRRIGDVQF